MSTGVNSKVQIITVCCMVQWRKFTWNFDIKNER